MPIIKHIPRYAAPKRLLSYVTNEKKTEKTLVTGLNCFVNAADAYEDIKFNFEMFSGERFFKRSIKSDTAKRERQKIRLHHYIQSFKPGEATPEEAHQIGVEWAERVFGKIIRCFVQLTLIVGIYTTISPYALTIWTESTGTQTRKQ